MFPRVRLIEADCMNYKRLRDGVMVDVDPALVCIVGPNEAGKSSFLDALEHLDHNEPYSKQEKTRGTSPGDTIQVRARFLLEEDDKALLQEIPEAKDARHFVIWKKGKHDRGYRVDPQPMRDRSRRRDVRERVQRLRDSGWPPEADGDDEGESPSTGELIEQALAALGDDTETLSLDHEVPTLASLLERLRSDTVPHASRGLPDRLEKLVQYERATHPHDRARALLKPRVPRVLKFGEDDRSLGASYALGTDDDPALRNLLALAGTSYEEAAQVAGGDRGRKTVWLDRTRARLRERFSLAWNQSDLTVRFDLDGQVLTILMSMQADDYIEIDQRSDGLRQFVALRAFVALADTDVKPILLIDEADTHLHYDAQADLVQVLEEQDEVAKVIYTTHSAGCLPRDLGTGIRAIVPTCHEVDGKRVLTDDSEAVNRFWTHGRGFSPILIAMGASALAFAATRRAVIAEGMSDTLLLPSLIREAIGEPYLDYQIAPSFAEATVEDVADLDLVASRVAYLADGDKGGQDHAKKLKKSGVLNEQILFLAGKGSGLSVEDLLVKDVYLRAVNAELSRWYDFRIKPENIPDVGRSSAVARWCARRKRPDNGRPVQVSKVDIAQRVLDQRVDRNLLAPSRRQLLRSLDSDIRSVLDRATQTLSR